MFRLILSLLIIWALWSFSFIEIEINRSSTPNTFPILFDQSLEEVTQYLPQGGFEDCQHTEAVCEFIANELGAVLIVEEYAIRENKEGEKIWGETSGDTIWVYQPLCMGVGLMVFFHEVGHVKLHFDVRSGIGKEQSEQEANDFSANVLEYLQ